MLAVCRAHEKICTPRTRVRGVVFLFELVNKLVDQRLLLRLERRPALKKLVLLIRQLHKIPSAKNCANVMPKDLQMSSRDAMLG